jgi:uncharacterized protein YbaR (Trm112 family)
LALLPRDDGPLADRLFSALACPQCRRPLCRVGGGVRCRGCGRIFPVEDGIPRLLPTDAEVEVAQASIGARELLPPRLVVFADRYRRFLRPSLARKFATARAAADFARSFSPDALLLNVGAGEEWYGENVVNLDIRDGPSINVVGAAEQLPFLDASFDACVLQAVLEHVRSGRRVLEEVHRVLKPRGSVLVDAPFVYTYHPAPRDYRRFTEEGLRAELQLHGFEVEKSGVAVGPASAMAAVSAEFLALLLSGRSASVYRLARLVTSLLAMPLKYADVWLERHPMAYTVASGVWVLARKSRRRCE